MKPFLYGIGRTIVLTIMMLMSGSRGRNEGVGPPPPLDLNLSIINGIVSSKHYDKWDDFNFEIVKFQFLDGDVPCSPSYGVYISQLIRFARVCSNIDDLNNKNLFLTSKLLKQGYRYHKIRKEFF